jgi:dihydrofolate reductase
VSTVQYQCAISLDGFLAGPGGDMQWLNDVEPVRNPLFEDLAARVDVILCGARTYRGDDPNAGSDAEGAYGGTYDGATVVLTHHPDPDPPPGVEFAGDLDTALARCRELAGTGLVAVFGADVARQCLEAGALDEVLVLVLPVMLGDGTRLLDRPGGDPVRLEVIGAEELGLHARVVR